MPKRSLFNQFNQVRGSLTFQDLRDYNDLAQTAGRPYLTGTLTVVSGSATVTDSANIFNKNEQNNFIVIDAGSAAGVYQITADGTSGNQATITPTPMASDAAVSYRRHYYQNLEDDLNYLRTMLGMVIGETNWYDQPDTDLRNMSYLIPKVPNEVGQTAQYTQRPGTVAYNIANINHTAYVSTGAPADEYTDNTSSVTPGTDIRFTDSSTISISIGGGFYPADKGVLRIMRDGAVVGSLDLAAAWTSDNCAYESTDVAGSFTNPNHTSSNTGIDIINLTNRRCMNTSVDGFSSFWPPYQIASMNASLVLPAGFQGQISVMHTLGGSQNYTYSSFFVDTTSQVISPTAPTFAANTPVLKYLSGVPYYTTNSTFNCSITHNVTIFDRGYELTPLTLNLTQFNSTNQTPTLAQLGLTPPLAITSVIGTYNTTLTVGTGNFRNMDARGTASITDTFSTATSANSAAGTFRIDTYGNTSSATAENFDDEAWRFVGTEDFTNITINNTNSVWNSQTNITTLTEKGLVVYNGTLQYPSINHSTFLPAGPNYTAQSGDFVYYRVFSAASAFTKGTITFGGWSDALSMVQGANVEVYLRYPNCSDYSNNNTSLWQDLGIDETVYGGNGCLGAGSSGSDVAFSFGTRSSASFGNHIIMKIVFKSSSVTALTSVTFNPTL